MLIPTKYDLKICGRGAKPTAQSKFCEETLKEFLESDMDVAEVTGFPEGKTFVSIYSGLRGKLGTLRIDNIFVSKIEGKIYLIRKQENG